MINIQFETVLNTNLLINNYNKRLKIMQKTQEINVVPQYVHLYPYRFVRPYPHTYRTFTKGRWLNKPLLQTLVKQFKAYPPQYYQQAIASGAIKVNGKQILPNYTLKNGDEIIHTSIRMQPPILDLPIDIVHECEDFVIVNKPPSVVVHTGGGQHFNTVEALLKFQYGYQDLHVLHRLDKCTSGLLIFARDKDKVSLFHQQSENQTMKKMYFARVNGQIQWNQKDLCTYIECISHKDGIYKAFDEFINWRENQAQGLKKQEQNQIGLNKQQKNENKESVIKDSLIISSQQKQDQSPKQHIKNKIQEKNIRRQKFNKKAKDNRDIKDARTIFKKIWYDEISDSTLLQCYPITGRTHQIRVHLQYLGHPILNDVAYGGRFVGNNIINYIKTDWSEKEEGIIPNKKVKPVQQINIEQWDYKIRSWQIMLHSYRYRFGGKQFTTKLPYWYKKQAISKQNFKQNIIAT